MLQKTDHNSFLIDFVCEKDYSPPATKSFSTGVSVTAAAL